MRHTPSVLYKACPFYAFEHPHLNYCKTMSECGESLFISKGRGIYKINRHYKCTYILHSINSELMYFRSQQYCNPSYGLSYWKDYAFKIKRWTFRLLYIYIKDTWFRRLGRDFCEHKLSALNAEWTKMKKKLGSFLSRYASFHFAWRAIFYIFTCSLMFERQRFP